jgi:predicted MFS family arabinose efflux permease
MWAAVSSLGLALGPLIGSVLVFGWSWRAIFWANVLFGVLAFISAAVVLPESADPVRAQFDIAGFLVGALALGSLTFAIILGETLGYRTWRTDLLFALALITALTFVVVELRATNPVLDVRYFKRPAFVGSNVIAVTAYFGAFAIFFMVALYLQVVGNNSPLRLALTFVPLAVGMVAAPLFTGRWVAAWGPRIPMATGCLLAGAGILLTNAMITPNAGIGRIGWTMFLAGVGVGMAMVAVTSAALGSVPAEHSGMASSATNTFRELGAVVGVAVLGAVIYGQLTVNLVRRLTALGIPKPFQSLVVSAVTTGSFQGGAKAAAAQRPAIAPIVNEVVSAAYSAFGQGLDLALNVAGSLLLASAILALATVYGRRIQLERVNSKDGHLLYVSVEGRPGLPRSEPERQDPRARAPRRSAKNAVETARASRHRPRPPSPAG